MENKLNEFDVKVSKNQGLVIGVLGLLLVALFASLIYWYIVANRPLPAAPTPLRPTYETNREPESTNAQAQVDSFGVMSTSDELGAIEADLESTNLDALEAEMIQINEELQLQ